MKLGINVAPMGSYDTPLFNDLLAQAQKPRPAPGWSPTGDPGDAMTEDKLVAQGMSWTILRDGSEVTAPYLSGTYENQSEATLHVNGNAVPTGGLVELADPREVSVFIENNAGRAIEMPRLVRVGQGDALLQPAVSSAIQAWEFVRTMQGQRDHLRRSPLLKRRPWSDSGYDVFAARQMGHELHREVHITLSIDTVMDPDRLVEALKAAHNPDRRNAVHVGNEVWNYLFPETQRWMKFNNDDFWLAMRQYAKLTALVKSTVQDLGLNLDVHIESNQHITGLTKVLREHGDYDVMMFNGYLYLDSGDRETANQQLWDDLDAWEKMTKSELVSGERWGLYEQGIHVRNAGTPSAAAGANDAKKLITRGAEGQMLTEAHLNLCEGMDCESVAAYCFEREPRSQDPEAVFEFGIRQGLLLPDRDSRFDAYVDRLLASKSVVGKDMGKANPEADAAAMLLQQRMVDMEGHLRSAADLMRDMRQSLGL